MAQPASPEALHRFKEGFECWNRGEVDRMQDMYAEDAVFDRSAVFTDTPPLRGHTEMRRYWDELRETWAGIRQEPVPVIDMGDGRYVVEIRLRGTGQRSGIDVDQRFAMLYTLREDGKATRAQLFPDIATAQAAVEPTTPLTP